MRTAAAVFAFLALAGASFSGAEAPGNNAAPVQRTAATWMSALPGTLKLSQLTIPGTHNSAALREPIAGTAKCQFLGIAAQLAAGVRYFDIRCRHVADAFLIHHGPVSQNLGFAQVLEQVTAFLTANPGECVLLVVKEEHQADRNTRAFAETFRSQVAADPARWWLGTAVPDLAQVRGKIVLIRRFGGFRGGIDATNWPDNAGFERNKLVVEDQYLVPDNAVKWGRVRAALEAAAADVNPDRLHLIHSSGYRPGLFGIPSVPAVANDLNPRLSAWFTGRAPGGYGCVITDFMDARRAALILETNFKPDRPEP